MESLELRVVELRAAVGNLQNDIQQQKETTDRINLILFATEDGGIAGDVRETRLKVDRIIQQLDTSNKIKNTILCGVVVAVFTLGINLGQRWLSGKMVPTESAGNSPLERVAPATGDSELVEAFH